MGVTTVNFHEFPQLEQASKSNNCSMNNTFSPAIASPLGLRFAIPCASRVKKTLIFSFIVVKLIGQCAGPTIGELTNHYVNLNIVFF